MENNQHNDHNQIHNDLRENVLNKIREGKVHMRPKFYFLLKVIFLVIIAAIIFVTSTLFLSFMLFSIRVSGEFFLLGFGWRGLQSFILLFPWKTFLVFLMLLVVLEKVVKRFKFGYRSPLVYLVVSIIALILAAGIIIGMTSLHTALFRRAKQDHLPVVGDYYRHARQIPREHGVFRGTVTSIDGNTFVIQSDDTDDAQGDDAPKKIMLPPDVQIGDVLSVGDKVFVAGDLQNGVVRAFGIRKILPADEE